MIYRDLSSHKRVEALQWKEDNYEDILYFVAGHTHKQLPPTKKKIVCIRGTMESTLYPGDYALRIGINDGILAVRKEDFESGYESLEPFVSSVLEMKQAINYIRETNPSSVVANSIGDWAKTLEDYIGKTLYLNGYNK